MPNPYESLPERAFWKSAVAQRSLFEIERVWDPKFNLRISDKIVTFGSCFAQHIGRALSARGFDWYNAEPAPEGLSIDNSQRFNYGVFSARTGNIYTATLLEQWTRWALEEAPIPDEVWEKDGRVFDPFRPAIEPNGFASAAEMAENRKIAVAAFRKSFETTDYFVFTLGLTECWKNGPGGYEYPMCPGTVAGEYNPDMHVFHNQEFGEVYTSLERTVNLMRAVNPKLKLLLTVSPVPLTATNSGMHVMVATMESKSTLRAVAGHLHRRRKYVDYFPSYELINSPAIKGVFFQPNGRDVGAHGVSYVMDHFFNDLVAKFGSRSAQTKKSTPKAAKPAVNSDPSQSNATVKPQAKSSDVVCEEELLEAFGQ